jgi:hypothetical protein
METVKMRTKAFLYAQFKPAKTLRQLVGDRNCYRASLHVALVVALFL